MMIFEFSDLFKFRIKILESVISSSNANLVENIVYDTIQQKIQMGIPINIILQIIPILEFDLYFHKHIAASEKELNNVRAALTFLNKETVALNQ
jgi:hypothetical protein